MTWPGRCSQGFVAFALGGRATKASLLYEPFSLLNGPGRVHSAGEIQTDPGRACQLATFGPEGAQGGTAVEGVRVRKASSHIGRRVWKLERRTSQR